MKKELLKRLYWACTNEEDTAADGMKLVELYEHIEEAKKAAQQFSKKLYAMELTDGEKRLLDNLDGSVAMAHEMQGFVNGFRLGMKLAGELSGEVEE